MAAKKLQYSDIAENNLFEPLIKELKQVNDELEKTKATLTGVAKESAKAAKITPLDGYENAERVVASVEKLASTQAKMDKLDKERVALQQKLKDLTDDRAKANAELAAEVQAQAKALRDNAKAAREGQDAYKELAAQSNAAQSEFKKLAAQFGVNSTQAIAAQKAFEAVNDKLQAIDKAARDGRRNVGRYEIAVEGLKGAFEKLNGKLDQANKLLGAVGVIGLLNTLVGLFKENEGGGAAFEKVMGRITVTLQVFINRVVTALPAFVAQFKAAFVEIQLGIASATNVMGSNQTKVNQLTAELAKLTKEAAPAAKAFDNITQEIEKQIALNDKLIDKRLRDNKEIAALINANNEMKVSIEQLRAAGDDDFKSMESRIAAQKELIPLLEKTAKNNTEIARIAAETAKLENERAFNSSATQKALAEANDAYLSAKAEEVALVKENTKILNAVETDLYELRLDYSLDLVDNIKTVNEQIIADETISLEQRRKIQDQTQKVFERSLKRQTDITNEYLKALAVNNRAQGVSAEEAAKAAVQIDLHALAMMEDENAIMEHVKALGLNEKAGIRILQAIRDYRTGIQDLTASNQTLVASELEAQEIRLRSQPIIKAESEVNAKRTASIVNYYEVLDKFLTTGTAREKKALEDQAKNAEEAAIEREVTLEAREIQILENRLAKAKEGSIEYLRIEKELADAVLAQSINTEKRRLDAQQKALDKIIEAEKRFAEDTLKVVEVVESTLEGISEKRLERIDKELTAETERVSSLQELADAGDRNAIENLALTQKRQAELERQRQQEIQRQKQAELALAAVKTYNSKLAQGDKNAFASTVTDVALLQSFIAQLPALFEGTEFVDGKFATKFSDGKDGYIARLHHGERVIGAEASAAIPRQMTNKEVAMAAREAFHGNPKTRANDFAHVGRKLDEVKQAIVEKPTYLGRDYDATEKAIIEKIMAKNKFVQTHKRQRLL